MKGAIKLLVIKNTSNCNQMKNDTVLVQETVSKHVISRFCQAWLQAVLQHVKESVRPVNFFSIYQDKLQF